MLKCVDIFDELEMDFQSEQVPPKYNPPVALDLEEPEDWHIRALMAQILFPVHNLLGVIYDGSHQQVVRQIAFRSGM